MEIFSKKYNYFQLKESSLEKKHLLVKRIVRNSTKCGNLKAELQNLCLAMCTNIEVFKCLVSSTGKRNKSSPELKNLEIMESEGFDPSHNKTKTLLDPN